MTHHILVTSAIGHQQVKSVARGRALAAMAYQLQGTAHWNKPVKVTVDGKPWGEFGSTGWKAAKKKGVTA